MVTGTYSGIASRSKYVCGCGDFVPIFNKYVETTNRINKTYWSREREVVVTQCCEAPVPISDNPPVFYNFRLKYRWLDRQRGTTIMILPSAVPVIVRARSD